MMLSIVQCRMNRFVQGWILIGQRSVCKLRALHGASDHRLTAAVYATGEHHLDTGFTVDDAVNADKKDPKSKSCLRPLRDLCVHCGTLFMKLRAFCFAAMGA